MDPSIGPNLVFLFFISSELLVMLRYAVEINALGTRAEQSSC